MDWRSPEATPTLGDSLACDCARCHLTTHDTAPPANEEQRTLPLLRTAAALIAVASQIQLWAQGCLSPSQLSVTKGFAKGPQGSATLGQADILTSFAARAR